MYAYVDETGNTGQNLFDEAQPTFITAALMSRDNFDDVYRERLRRLANRIGEQVLHANQLGLGRIEDISPDLLDILKYSDTRFFLSRVDKMYLATSKIVDTVFDSGENLAVPWHAYNYRPLRLLLVFKVAHLLDKDLVRRFWASLMESNKAEAYREFVIACEELRSRVGRLPDMRSRELVSEALQWAIDNPEAIYLHSNSKLARYGHLPNMVAFANLLEGIEQQSKLWGRLVKRICHDRQMQFKSSLGFWHELFSNAAPGPLFLPGGDRQLIRRVFESEFVMATADDSPGIQVVDIILWLFRRIMEGKGLGPKSTPLMRHVFRSANHHDFSFENTSRHLGELVETLYQAPITEEQMRKGRELLDLAESRRQKRMEEYAEKKLLEASNACD